MRRLAIHAVALLGLLCGAGCGREDSRPHNSAQHETTDARSADLAANDQPIDDRYRQRILGRWEDDYQGHRTMTIRADGTATMVVEPSGISATLYAKVLTFHERWVISDGQLTLKVTSGEPKARVNLILKAMGDTSTLQILELSDSDMKLQDVKDGTQYHWRRLADE